MTDHKPEPEATSRPVRRTLKRDEWLISNDDLPQLLVLLVNNWTFLILAWVGFGTFLYLGYHAARELVSISDMAIEAARGGGFYTIFTFVFRVSDLLWSAISRPFRFGPPTFLTIFWNIVPAIFWICSALVIGILFSALRNVFTQKTVAMPPLSSAFIVSRAAWWWMVIFAAAHYITPLLVGYIGAAVPYQPIPAWGGIVVVCSALLIRNCISLPKAEPRRTPVEESEPTEIAPLGAVYEDLVEIGGRSVIFKDATTVSSESIARREVFRTETDQASTKRQVVDRLTATHSLSPEQSEVARDFLSATSWKSTYDDLRTAAGVRLDENVMLQEPLTDLHFDLLVQAIHLSQDVGGSTIVYCPEPSYTTVFRRLTAAFQSHCPDITQTWWDSDREPYSPAESYNVLFIHERAFQEKCLGDTLPTMGKVLERLRLLIVIDQQRLVPSMHRLHTGMLWASVGARQIKVIVQSATRRGLRSELASLYSNTGREFRSFSFRRSNTPEITQSDTYRLVMENSQAVRDSLAAMFLRSSTAGEAVPSVAGFDIAPAILLPGLSREVPIIHHDSRHGRRRLAWGEFQRVFNNVTSGSGRYRAEWISRIPSDSHPFSGNRPTFIYTEDDYNLEDVLSDFTPGTIPFSALVVCCVYPYPLRGLFDHRLTTRAGVTPGEEISFIPFSPKPRGGLRELALLLLFGLLRRADASGSGETGISRGEVTDLFTNVPAPGLTRAFGLSATRSGIIDLLRLQFPSVNFDIERSKPELRIGTGDGIILDDTRYVCRNHDTLPRALHGYLPVRSIGGSGQESDLGWLERDDNGLLYSYATLARINGRQIKLKLVSDYEAEGEEVRGDAALYPNINGTPITHLTRLYDVELGQNRDSDTSPSESGGMLAPKAVPLGTLHDESTSARTRHIRMLASVPIRRFSVGHQITDGLVGQKSAKPKFLNHAYQKANFPNANHPSTHALIIRLEVLENDFMDRRRWSRVAFTLCAGLSDVLYSLYPGLGHRLAVLSPQSEDAIRELLADPGDIAERILFKFPRLVSEAPESVFAPPMDRENCEAALGEFMGAQGFGSRRDNASDSSDRLVLDLIVLEDWPADLGVARSVDENEFDVMNCLRSFMVWIKDHPQSPSNPYLFGADETAAIFDIPGALKVVDALRGEEIDWASK